MNNKYLDIIFTNHAISRLYNRGISQSDAYDTLKNYDEIKEGTTLGSKKFCKNYGEQRIEVVGKKNDQDQWVVLSCWSRLPGKDNDFKPKDNFPERIINNLLNKILKKKNKL